VLAIAINLVGAHIHPVHRQLAREKLAGIRAAK